MQNDRHARRAGTPYVMLAVNLLASAVVMYFVMFTMIDGWADFFHNLNMAYMVLMMVAPMAILMILTMRQMYGSRAANIAITVGFTLVFTMAYASMRQQTAIGDAQFLRSMIPHHSGAILMCREADLDDREIRALCEQIVRSQRREIGQMKQILDGI